MYIKNRKSINMFLKTDLCTHDLVETFQFVFQNGSSMSFQKSNQKQLWENKNSSLFNDGNKPDTDNHLFNGDERIDCKIYQCPE